MSKMWDAMNDLEMLVSKVCSAREIIDVANVAIGEHNYDKAESLTNAAYEFLGYYLDEFDAKFKVAWQETVMKTIEEKEEEEDPCMPPWGHSDLEYGIHHNDTIKEENLVRSWHITVDEAYNKDGETIFSYLQFPDSLMERMELKPESKIQWIVNPDDTVTIRKVE
jgi:hypothetical protein